MAIIPLVARLPEPTSEIELQPPNHELTWQPHGPKSNEVEYSRADGSVAGDCVQLVDFARPAVNDWFAVNQFTVIESQHNRRPDVVVFVNGLPLVIIELKKRGRCSRHDLVGELAAADIQGRDSFPAAVQRITTPTFAVRSVWCVWPVP